MLYTAQQLRLAGEDGEVSVAANSNSKANRQITAFVWEHFADAACLIEDTRGPADH